MIPPTALQTRQSTNLIFCPAPVSIPFLQVLRTMCNKTCIDHFGTVLIQQPQRSNFNSFIVQMPAEAACMTTEKNDERQRHICLVAPLDHPSLLQARIFNLKVKSSTKKTTSCVVARRICTNSSDFFRSNVIRCKKKGNKRSDWLRCKKWAGNKATPVSVPHPRVLRTKPTNTCMDHFTNISCLINLQINTMVTTIKF